MSAPLEEPPLWTAAHAGEASSFCASTFLRGTAFGTAVDTALLGEQNSGYRTLSTQSFELCRISEATTAGLGNGSQTGVQLRAVVCVANVTCAAERRLCHPAGHPVLLGAMHGTLPRALAATRST